MLAVVVLRAVSVGAVWADIVVVVPGKGRGAHAAKAGRLAQAHVVGEEGVGGGGAATVRLAGAAGTDGVDLDLVAAEERRAVDQGVVSGRTVCGIVEPENKLN